MIPRFEYDVAFSFAGEDREYVEKVADILRKTRVRVFYDRYEEAELWGKNLYEHLDQVYREKARFCVMFISEHYARKLWTSHERKSAQARAFADHMEYILPARFDDTEIPGLHRTIGYVDLREKSPEEFALLIQQKLGKGSPAPIDAPNIQTPASTSSLVSDRAFFWREHSSHAWLVTTLASSINAQLDSYADSFLSVLHGLRLPEYLAEPLTSSPNPHNTRSTHKSLVHEDFRALHKGVGFRIEIQDIGLIEYAICLGQLLSRFDIDLLKKEVSVDFLPGSAALDQCEGLLPFHVLGDLFTSQIQALWRLWHEPAVPIEVLLLKSSLFGVKGVGLFVPGRWDALIGYPLEEDELSVEIMARKDASPEELIQALFPKIIRAFGLRLDKVFDGEGHLNRPTTFAR